MRRLGDGGLVARARALVRGLGIHRGGLAAGPRATLVVGHRGAAREEAENTLPSFALALERGADAVEADICVTADGRFVVWHDADPDERVALARQAGLEKLRYQPRVPDLGSRWRRKVRELTLEEFLAHHAYAPSDDDDAGGRASGRRAEPITLDELLGWATAQDALTDLFLDVKLDEGQAGAGRALVELLEERMSSDELPTLHLLSPCERVVREMARRAQRCSESIRVSADFELPGADRLGPETGAPDVSLGCGERLWTGFRGDADACVRARVRGVFGMVTAWTLSEEKRLRTLVRDGVDAILTDDAGLLRRIVEESNDGARRRSRRHPEARSAGGSPDEPAENTAASSRGSFASLRMTSE